MIGVDISDDNLNILKAKILKGGSYGVFISPILNESEKATIVSYFKKPFIFARIPICYPKQKRTVEFEIKSKLEPLWLPALEAKSDCRYYKGIRTISYEHFVNYVVNTFGRYGIILIMRNHPIGFIGKQRQEKIDELEHDSIKSVMSVSEEGDALRLLQKIDPNDINESARRVSSQNYKVKSTEWTYSDAEIQFSGKTVFKAKTAKYIVLKLLFTEYNKGSGVVSKEEIVTALAENGHRYNVSTIKTLISKIRNNIRGRGDIECIKDSGRKDNPGYCFVPIVE